MDFLEMAKTRYSARSYSDKKIEKEKLDKILEAGRIAPTAVNFQPQKIIVVQSEAGLAKIASAAKTYNPAAAPIVCADTDISWKRRRYDNMDSGFIDASIVTTYMMLEARALEVDSLWICAFNPDIIKKEFDLPENIVPVNILELGYADCEPKSSDRYDAERKPLSETVFYEKLGS